MGYDVRVEADRVLLGRFVSAALLVDSRLQVIQFRGQTGPFMGPLSGAASLNVLKLVDEALLPALRYGLSVAQKTKRDYRRTGLVARLQGVLRELDLEVVPLRTPQTDELSCLIVLSEVPASRQRPRGRSAGGKAAGARQSAQLLEELTLTREQLQVSLLEQESSRESLLATLEELQTSNDDLQVANEELAIGQEELRNSNEELTTAHDEVQLRNAELNQLIHDHVNLVEAASIAAALFGADLRLRRVTPLAARALRLSATDIGRPLAELSMGFLGCDLAKLVSEAIAAPLPRTVEVLNDTAQRLMLTIRPYHSVDGQTDGAVLTLLDVTALRGAEEALALAEQRICALERAAYMRGGSN